MEAPIKTRYDKAGPQVAEALRRRHFEAHYVSTAQEALELADRFLRMIRGEATEAEKESLDEAAILEDVSHMPARVKCATLGWHTIQEMLKDKEA